MVENVYVVLYFSSIFFYLFLFMLQLPANMMQKDNGSIIVSRCQLGLSGKWVGVRCVMLLLVDAWLSVISVGDLHLSGLGSTPCIFAQDGHLSCPVHFAFILPLV